MKETKAFWNPYVADFFEPSIAANPVKVKQGSLFDPREWRVGDVIDGKF